MAQTILIYGLVWTSLYSLIAIGFSLIFGVADVVNLSHGMIIMGASYAVYLLLTYMNWTLAACMVGGIVVALLLMLIIYLAFIKKMLVGPHTSMLLLTIGLAMAVQQIIIIISGPQTKFVPSILAGSTSLLGVVLSNQQLLDVGVALSLVIVLGLFLRWGKRGRAIRAVSQDRDTAAISGINTEEIYIITIIITGLLAGIAGVLVAPIETVMPEIGWEMMITAFAVTVLAGLGGPIWGIVLSAAIVAYAELLTAFLISPMLKEATAFTILILALMFKPSGLFGKKRI